MFSSSTRAVATSLEAFVTWVASLLLLWCFAVEYQVGRIARYRNQALQTRFQFKIIDTVRLDFHAYVDKFPHQLQHDVENEFSALDLAFQNRV